jgi:hypothetical protein
MPTLHDYKCEDCEKILEDELENPGRCECGGGYAITFEKWKHFNQRRDVFSDNVTHGTTGDRRCFSATEDPTAMIEMGFNSDPSSNGIRTFSPEQSDMFRQKLFADGDTPKLRREILETRLNNLGQEAQA